MDLSVENSVLLVLLMCYSVGQSGFRPRGNLLRRLEVKESTSLQLFQSIVKGLCRKWSL